jgi:hypothetical protein
MHVMICGRDGCDTRDIWHDRTDTWVTPQRVLMHFRNKGWGIGKDRTHDLCPECIAAQRAMRPLEREKKRERSMVTAAMLPPPSPVAIPAELLAEVEPAPAPAPPKPAPPPRLKPRRAHSPIYAPREGRKNQPLMTRGFGDVKYAERSAVAFVQRMGVRTPKRGRDFRVFQLADGWGWDAILTTKEPSPMTDDSNIVAIRRTPAIREMSTPMTNTNDDSGPRASTIAQRREIRDYLDANYDEDNARWRGELSDKKAAEDLSMPRAWITQVRETTYGPDVNEADAKAREVDAQTLKQISDLEGMITEIGRELTALRAKVEGRPRL